MQQSTWTLYHPGQTLDTYSTFGKKIEGQNSTLFHQGLNIISPGTNFFLRFLGSDSELTFNADILLAAFHNFWGEKSVETEWNIEPHPPPSCRRHRVVCYMKLSSIFEEASNVLYSTRWQLNRNSTKMRTISTQVFDEFTAHYLSSRWPLHPVQVIPALKYHPTILAIIWPRSPVTRSVTGTVPELFGPEVQPQELEVLSVN
jgi:hypothetical protein